MRDNKLSNIICKGRYSRTNNLIPCKTQFSHVGHWGDRELIEHERIEKESDCHEHWHVGFEEDGKFQKFKDSVEQVKDEVEE